MKKNSSKVEDYSVSAGTVISLTKRNVQIRCIHGSLVVTWPWSGDVILCRGEKISVTAKGKVCVSSIENSSFTVEEALPAYKRNFTGRFFYSLNFRMKKSLIRNMK